MLHNNFKLNFTSNYLINMNVQINIETLLFGNNDQTNLTF